MNRWQVGRPQQRGRPPHRARGTPRPSRAGSVAGRRSMSRSGAGERQVARHERGPGRQKPCRKRHDKLYWLHASWRRAGKIPAELRIGEFRRHLMDWNARAQSSARQDVEMQGDARMPFHEDPEGAIGARALDAVEAELLQIQAIGSQAPGDRQPGVDRQPGAPVPAATQQAASSNGSERPMSPIQPQAPLSAEELQAVYRIGHWLLLGRTSEAHQNTPRARVPLATGRMDSGAATTAETLVSAMQEEPQCTICLEPASPEAGQLTPFGPCQHTFHTQCILRWVERPGRTTCPLCRGPLTPESLEFASSSRSGAVGPVTIDLLDDNDDDVIERSAAFSADDTRQTTLEVHCQFLRGLGQVDRLALQFPSPLVGPDRAEAFVHRWCLAREIGEDWLSQTATHTVSDPNEHFWVECALADARRRHSAAQTETWHTAFHGSNMSCLRSVLHRGHLLVGPRAKCSTRHGRNRQFGVYSHKHGTRAKAANYLKYFQYPNAGFIAAPLLQLKVRTYIARGTSGAVIQMMSRLWPCGFTSFRWHPWGDRGTTYCHRGSPGMSSTLSKDPRTAGILGHGSHSEGVSLESSNCHLAFHCRDWA